MVSSSVRELTARCPSSISLQAFRIPMLSKAVIYCWDTAELIDRFCALRVINKDWSKMKVRIDYGKVFLRVALTIPVNIAMTLKHVNHLCRALLFSYPAQKGWCSLRFCMHQVIQVIVDYTFVGNLKTFYLMTGVRNHASTHSFVRNGYDYDL